MEQLNAQSDKEHQQQQLMLKNLDRLNTQADNHKQHQTLMKYIESSVKEKLTTTFDMEGSLI